MNPVVFHVEAAGEFRAVELTFATEAEVRRVGTWRKMIPATDAGEFAALAAKRWFYYTREGATAASLEELRRAINQNARREVAFLMVASAEWEKAHQFLALAYCRSTWCHHLVLDFLAVRPGLSFEGQPIRGVGTGVIFGLAILADLLGVSVMWGEATASSAPFYERVLGFQTVRDLFIIRRGPMERLRQRYRARLKERLAPREWRRYSS